MSIFQSNLALNTRFSERIDYNTSKQYPYALTYGYAGYITVTPNRTNVSRHVLVVAKLGTPEKIRKPCFKTETAPPIACLPFCRLRVVDRDRVISSRFQRNRFTLTSPINIKKVGYRQTVSLAGNGRAPVRVKARTCRSSVFATSAEVPRTSVRRVCVRVCTAFKVL